VAVLEVGLGGRLDATNVVEPLASAIVSVDFDHEVYLGRTLAAIAREKAGVMRAGRATVVGPLPGEALRAVLTRARATGARVVEAKGRRLAAALRPLPGAHQRENLRVAIGLLEEARRAGVPVDRRALSRGVASTRWPGRLETVPGDPPLLLDGAHNPAGARALAAYLASLPPYVLLFGAMGDKDVRGLARQLFPGAVEIVLTRPRVARAATPDTLARRAAGFAHRARREPSVARGLALARRLARAHGPSTTVVVAGSLYLVGAVEAILERERRRG
jgi:dihydrofolate synthase/folylpolyglutamate synthase